VLDWVEERIDEIIDHSSPDYQLKHKNENNENLPSSSNINDNNNLLRSEDKDKEIQSTNLDKSHLLYDIELPSHIFPFLSHNQPSSSSNHHQPIEEMVDAVMSLKFMIYYDMMKDGFEMMR